MGCACKVGRDLSYLQKKYGVKNVPDNKTTNIRQNSRIFLEKVLLSLILLPFIPILLI